MKASEVYEQVTNRIVADLEAGVAKPGDWHAPWHSAGFLPRNASTGNAYRGGNVFSLLYDAEKAGYSGPYWATFRQWDGLNRTVAKGQKASYGIKWVTPEDKKHKGEPDDGRNKRLTDAQLRRSFPSAFAVFHYDQTLPLVARCSCKRGFTSHTDADEHVAEKADAAHILGDVTAWEPPAVKDAPDAVPGCEAFFSTIGADVRKGDTRAYYSPVLDYIGVPALADFDHATDFYATLAHEHTHWTGHESRLARDLKNRFGSDAYAAEELVAELGAAFTCANLGIVSEPRADHAQYLASWLKVLKADPKALYTAASAAQAAADYLAEKAGIAESEAAA